MINGTPGDGEGMKGFLVMLAFIVFFLPAAELLAADKNTIKKNVDAMVVAINNGKPATSFAADAYTPYTFIMEENGKLLVHPHLKGEYLLEKAAPIYEALQQATPEGLWVNYLWKGAKKHTYVRKTNNNLIVGSGY